MLASQRPPNSNPLSSSYSYSSSSTMPVQPASTLKRKRPIAPAYRSETTVDRDGRIREIIVIDDDSPTPQPTQQGTLSLTPAGGTHSASAAMSSAYTQGVRTRAQAAQAAAEASGSISSSRAPPPSSSTTTSAPAAKRRRRDAGPVASGSGAQSAQTTAAGGSSALRRKALAAKAYEATPTQAAYAAGTNGVYKNGSTTLREVRSHLASLFAIAHFVSVFVSQMDRSHLRSRGRRRTTIRRVIISSPQATWSAPHLDVCVLLVLTVSHFHRLIGFFTSCTDRIVRLLGQGTFGKVVEAFDMNTRSLVAVKIIRSIPKYRDASKIEVRVLKTLKQNDPSNKQ